MNRTTTNGKRKATSSIDGPASTRRRIGSSSTNPTTASGADAPSASRSVNKQSSAKGKEKASQNQNISWPGYFDELYKTYKALNTVIAFCSSRKHIATTFSSIQSSVEKIIRRPLDLLRVSEIKAILPDLIKFAYVDAVDLRIHSDGTSWNQEKDIYAPVRDHSLEVTGKILVLEFLDTPKNQKPELEGFVPGYGLPSLTPTEVKKLIERRNARFVQAVDELLLACRNGTEPEDPISLVTRAAREHLPLDPSQTHNNSAHGTIPGPSSRPSIDDILEQLEGADEYRDQIVHRRTFDAREAQNEELSLPLSDNIKEALSSSMGVTQFYSHQANAINALHDGKHVIVSTGTASGKSVIYQVPLLRFLEEDPDSTAMFIFPTKALAQDQMAALQQLLSRCKGLENTQIATYDGDTPAAKRAGIRENASVIFTNFDMLHVAILPHEDMWRRFLKNLKLIVVDELHYYSGTLGSHAAFVMRRLRRVCAAVGNRHSSATIANPASHMKNIFGVEDVEAITEDGSPSGRKDFIVWNPPIMDPEGSNARRASSLTEACTMFTFLITRGVKTILFCKIRKTCELAIKTARAMLAERGHGDVLDRVRGYRGGYSQEDRRAIERDAFSGKLLGIIATNALELGINIGSLDAVVMLGFPFSVASLRQQAGRAGRRLQDSLAVFVPDSLPIDQHFTNNPDEIFDKPMADLIVDLENEVILEGHLQCAAHEMPVSIANDEHYFGPRFKPLCEKRLTSDSEGWYHTHPKFMPRPSSHVAIRGVQELKYLVVDVTRQDGMEGRLKVMEELEVSRAMFETYEGGIFMHQGVTYLVREVSHDDRTAKVVETDVSWLTSPRDFTDIDPIETHRIRAIRGSPHRAYYGRIKLFTMVFGFFKIRNGVILDKVDLETPPFVNETWGMWIDVPPPTLDLFRRKGINPAEAIHAAEHMVLNMSPLFALASEGDVKTECKIPEKEYASTPSSRRRPARLTFYDAAGKNSGVCAKAFDHTSDLLQQALDRLVACDCESGCPSCIEASICRSGNLVTSKIGAEVVLRSVLNLPIDEDAIPEGDPDALANPSETVIEAPGVGTIKGLALEVENES
ncbi:hypothetical protein FRB99_004888 [Tulasnella sp. 403]|nr:hypothetical protein FRB99_004888 [Tulasnella sp. 403]